MSDKIKVLTEKIYDEGIAKAKVEATSIIENAKATAAQIIETAKKKEAKILEQAEIQANEYKEITTAEIQLASRQAINNIKQRITNLVTTAQVETPVKEAFKSGEFIKSIILTLIQNWNPQKPEELGLKILLPQKDEAELAEYFNSKAMAVLNNGIDIQFDSNTANGFKIGPKDGSYIISFSDQDFEEYFKGYLKDRTKKLLFPLPESNDEVKSKKITKFNNPIQRK